VEPASIFRDSGALRALLALVACGLSTAAVAQWTPLAKDEVHDPASPALGVLQEPGEALSRLPRDNAGNQVDWMRALNERAITPRATLKGDATVRLREDEILLNRNGGMPMVRFPHRSHTQWLDCANCHEHLFKSKTGANRLSMLAMLQGEQCGVCHGAVSFPLTECARCHNTPRPPPKTAANPGVK
jgi:c(7)-type cytochrome triheme protein